LKFEMSINGPIQSATCRSITILGATGSIGRSAEKVIQEHRESLRVEAVVGGRDGAALAAVARRLGARFAAVAEPAGLEALRSGLAGTGISSGSGEAAILEATARDSDIVLAAISGTAGLVPTHAALRPGRRIALANKESLVCAGTAFMADARRVGCEILPVDSEHNALDQALTAGPREDVATAIITASGGPFRTWTRDCIAASGPAQASAHPVWAMGAKINIDSATLMNKGLELIEAKHLFGLDADRLDVLVHPESIVHGLVQWRDGSVTAGLAIPDMCIPIANALRGLARLPQPTARLDLAAIGRLSFERADEARFPCLRLAREALRAGGSLPTVLNAANEVAVEAFMGGRIGFYGISELVEAVCTRMVGGSAADPGSVSEALSIDAEARALARERLPRIAAAQ
jgi:1-deoxy-D-xylulose-5-phosphate reductoisomerase